jgi:uncharacterized protein YoxC
VTVLALSAGDVALVVLAAFWGVLVLFLAVVMLNLFRLLESVKTLVDGIREETVPLLGEVRVTVRSVNKELERVDGLMESGGKMARSAERVTTAVEEVVTSPLIKIAAATAGVAAFVKRFRGSRS